MIPSLVSGTTLFFPFWSVLFFFFLRKRRGEESNENGEEREGGREVELIVGHYQKNYRTVKFTLRSRSKHLPLVKTLQNGIKESDREGFGRIGSRERERERGRREKKKLRVLRREQTERTNNRTAPKK